MSTPLPLSTRFRDVQLVDVLEAAYGMLRTEYLVAVQGAIAAAASWQQLEVGLFCLRAVSLRVKARAMGRNGAGPSSLVASAAATGDNAEAARGAAETHALLLTAFNGICSDSATSQ